MTPFLKILPPIGYVVTCHWLFGYILYNHVIFITSSKVQKCYFAGKFSKYHLPKYSSIRAAVAFKRVCIFNFHYFKGFIRGHFPSALENS